MPAVALARRYRQGKQTKRHKPIATQVAEPDMLNRMMDREPAINSGTTVQTLPLILQNSIVSEPLLLHASTLLL